MSTRESFLARVRKAVREGNRAGDAAPLPDRGAIGYQGAGADPLATFVDRCRAMGAFPVVVADRDELLAKIGQLLDAKNARKILVGRGRFIASLALGPWLIGRGCSTTAPTADKAELFAAEASITEVSALVAETGSLVVESGPEMSRSESLLPPIHIAVARADQIVADLFDLFDGDPAKTPSNLVFITGPSKTGDIELKLVTGVHGPGEVHVFILNRSLSLDA